MPTRAQIEGELIDSLGPKLTYVGLDGVTSDGTNANLNGPIRKAIASMGSVTASFIVQDSDLATFTGFDVERLIDFAKLEALSRISERSKGVDFKLGVTAQQLSQFQEQVLADIKLLEDRLRQPYGPLVPAPAVGTMQPQGMNDSPRLPNDPFDPLNSRSRPYRWPYP